MTRKRQLLTVFALITIACVALIVPAMLPPRPGVTKANFDLLQKGMAQNEIEAIFGRACPEPGWQLNERIVFTYVSDDGESFAMVGFDHQGRLVPDTCLWTGSSETLFYKLRRWFRLP